MKERGPSERPLWSVLLLILTAVCCAIVAIAAPRPVEPSRLPALRLAARLVEEQATSERERIGTAPRGPAADDVRRAFERDQREQVALSGDLSAFYQRRRALLASLRALFARLGPEAERAFVAELADRALRSLRATPSEPPTWLQDFAGQLERYGFSDAAGRELAPELAVRALYKARLNLLLERSLDHDLTPIERQAVHGFSALHAAGLPPTQRAQAARLFYEAGGERGAEALATWLYHGGLHADALRLLRREHARTGELRLRNLALFAALYGDAPGP